MSEVSPAAPAEPLPAWAVTALEERQRQLDRVRPWLLAAVEACGGTHTIEDVIGSLCAGSIQLWSDERCFAVTEFVNYPRARAINVFLAGGDIRRTKLLQPGIEAFGRAQGCTLLEYQGKTTSALRRLLERVGWMRAADGFHVVGISMRKRI